MYKIFEKKFKMYKTIFFHGFYSKIWIKFHFFSKKPLIPYWTLEQNQKKNLLKRFIYIWKPKFTSASINSVRADWSVDIFDLFSHKFFKPSVIESKSISLSSSISSVWEYNSLTALKSMEGSVSEISTSSKIILPIRGYHQI